MGKGDKQRPMRITKEEYDRNFDRIFGNKHVKGRNQDLNRVKTGENNQNKGIKS